MPLPLHWSGEAPGARKLAPRCRAPQTIHDDDPDVNPIGVTGVDEIGFTGSPGAIAEAMWHATGTRVRRFPVRIEALLAGA